VARSIADPTVYARAATALLTALASQPRTRLIVIGGAATSSQTALVFTDSSELVHQSTRPTRTAPGLRRRHARPRDALNVLRTSNRLWTYFSPAVEITPANAPAASGSAATNPSQTPTPAAASPSKTAAIALIDEAELPHFIQRRFTIGY